MKKLLGILILLLAIGVTIYLVTNTGEEDTDVKEDSAKDKNFGEIIKKDPKKKFEDGKTIDTPLQFTIEEVSDGATQFTYNVHNSGDAPETLAFSTGQRYEYEIYKGNELVKRYSDGMSFTQAMEDIVVEPGETVSFEVKIPDLEEEGEYRIDIYLVAKDLAATSKISKKFIIETSIN